MSRVLAAASILVALLLAPAAGAATYYVSNDGSDGASGTSPASAWRTVRHASRAVLRPGDSVLFKGGDTFTDSTLMPEASGEAGAPITFGSFGTGRATVSYHDSAVWFSGKSYLTFRDLVLTTGGSPVSVFASSPGGASTNIVLRDSVVR